MGCGEACNRLWDVARYGAWHGMGYGRAVRYGMVWEMVRYGIWYGTLYGARPPVAPGALSVAPGVPPAPPPVDPGALRCTPGGHPVDPGVLQGHIF